jgi:kynurenine formamidase
LSEQAAQQPRSGGAPVHLAALPHGVVFVEALGGLAAVPPRGAWFLFLPIRLAGGTNGPGRALAVLPHLAAEVEPGPDGDRRFESSRSR